MSGLERIAAVVEDYTGEKPPTCPWRAMYDPLVHAAISLSVAADGGYLDAVLDDSMPAVWVDALEVYARAKNTTRGRDLAEEAKKRKAKR